MKMCLKKLAVTLMSGFLLASAITVLPASPFVVEAEAHSGNTDSHGGHRDNRNASGLGSYHYHCGGHPAHLHTNGVCPYAASDTGTNPADQKQVPESKASVPETTATAVETGWKEDSAGWWYCTSDGQYYKDCWQNIDNQWYYFNPDGYMATGWHCQTDHCYYLASDGHMVTGEHDIDGEHCYFNTDGSLDDTTSHHGSGHHAGHHN
ncbi:MAG: YHYH domain-containing protein [Hungatella hathewayi]|nr:YHYH domain-containing protein [Hungatella hathewayi]